MKAQTDGVRSPPQRWTYAFENGLLVINTYFKTYITEGNTFKVNVLTKTELRFEDADFLEYMGEHRTSYNWEINGQRVDVVREVAVFKRK